MIGRPEAHNGAVAIRPPREDLYRELGVERGATADELNAAFRRKAKALHPDARSADPAATEEFKRVSRAYAVLRDPVERARYDALREAPTTPVVPRAADDHRRPHRTSTSEPGPRPEHVGVAPVAAQPARRGGGPSPAGWRWSCSACSPVPG